jgi:dolichol-phosphate mannosyltransferase/undecaprenyl-phosphate 4-deoxy-4-formamido-L-arabinose transferase
MISPEMENRHVQPAGSGRPGISVVVPVYNGSRSLPELVRQLAGVLAATAGGWEIVLVDDCSPDESWQVIGELCRRHPEVRGFQLMHNEGQATATLCGMARARGEVVVTMDDDLQHRPDQLPTLLAALEAHPEVDAVLGVFEEKHHAFYRNVGSRLIGAINAAAFRLPPGVRSSAFRVLRRPVVEAVASQRTMNPSIAVLLFGTTARVISVAVEHGPRHAGRSNYSFRKQVRLALDNICTATVMPLRVVSGLGLATCALSAGLICFYLYRYFTGRIGVAGWATVVLLLTFFSGVILLSLGVFGEYMVRVLREVRQRPMYVVRDSAGATVTAPGPGAGGGPERDAG